MGHKIHKICVIGLGYIGLPTAVLFASHGVNVVGVDLDQEMLTNLRHGQVNCSEPELKTLIQKTLQGDHFSAVNLPEPAEVFLITVPTPYHEKPDLSYVKSAIQSIIPCLTKNNLVIIESTVPVGTTESLELLINQQRPDLQDQILIAYCPERILPGNTLSELIMNDRVIGGINQQSAKRAEQLYQIFVQGKCYLTDHRTAELIKLAENTFRDVNIAYANELATVCDHFDLDVREVIKLANHHPRVNILQPGPGVGGHCIPVDPLFITHALPEQTPLIQTARQVNNNKPQQVVNQILLAAANFHQPIIACLGLSFKPDINDFRESPAIKIVQKLCNTQLNQILIVEPYLNKLPRSFTHHKNIQLVTLDQAVKKADILVLLVHHHCFHQMDFVNLSNKILIDTCGGWHANYSSF